MGALNRNAVATNEYPLPQGHEVAYFASSEWAQLLDTDGKTA